MTTTRRGRAGLSWPAGAIFAWFAALFVATPISAAEPTPEGPVCFSPPNLARLDKPLPHVTQRIAANAPLKIVAFGSSSTFGLGAKTPDGTYPARLQAELRRRFPEVPITVINRGVNGNETRQEMLRFDRDVLAEKPDLVIWQIGTNTLLAGHDMWSVFLDARAGIRRLKAQGADVILMNPQYSPRVLARTDYEAMLDLVDVTGRETDVDVFDRFQIMRNWAQVQRFPFDVFVTGDGLHMNDWGYDCLAKLLADGIGRAHAANVARH